MASNNEEDLDLEAQEIMKKQMEDLQLQQKRMKSLVDQRRQERLDMEKELMRMERMKKHMETMCKENEDVAETEKRLEEAKRLHHRENKIIKKKHLLWELGDLGG